MLLIYSFTKRLRMIIFYYSMSVTSAVLFVPAAMYI